MKKLPLFVALLTFLILTPCLASADDHEKHPKHHHVNATEISVLGFAAAIIVGGTGYLLLRRRKHA